MQLEVSAVEILSKILFQYGPFALTLLLLYKGHSAAKRNKETALAQQKDSFERRSAQWLYITVWAAIFVCMIFSSYVWYRINVQVPTIFIGDLNNLRLDDEVFFHTNDIIWKADTVADRKTIRWSYISPVPLADTFVLELTVQRVTRRGEITEARKTLLFRIDLNREALNRRVRVYYNGESDKLSVQVDGQPVPQVLDPVSSEV